LVLTLVSALVLAEASRFKPGLKLDFTVIFALIRFYTEFWSKAKDYNLLSYSRRVTVVICFLRKRWYTVSRVIMYSIRSSQSYTRRISPLSAVLYGAYKPCPENGFERTHLIGWRSTVLCSLWPTSCWLCHQSTV